MKHSTIKATDHIELGFDPTGTLRADIYNAEAEALWRNNVNLTNQVRQALRNGHIDLNHPSVEVSKAMYGVTFVDSDAPLDTWTEAFCDSLAFLQLDIDMDVATKPTRVAGFRAFGYLPEEAADFLRIMMGRTAYDNFIVWENEEGRCDRIEKSELPFGFLSDTQKRAVVAGELMIRRVGVQGKISLQQS